MVDIFDRAQVLEEREREAALLRHRNRHAEPRPNAKGRVCVDCGERIPSKRLAAHPHATRCIDHARAHEDRMKHFRRPQ